MIKIKSIEFFNHNIFGNQKFDFTIDEVNTFKNVIIAGENGSGKTKFLEELYNISNTIFYNNLLVKSHKTHEVVVDISDENYYNFNDENEKIKEAILVISKDDNENVNNTLSFISNGRVVTEVKKQNLVDKITRLRIKGLYSNVDINYNPINNIEGPTSETIDNESNEIPKDIAHKIIQLLVNISVQDSCDVDSWVGMHRDSLVPDNIYHKRLKRFTNAFKLMFGNSIQYKGIENNSIPIFEKDDNDIKISSLSSGEKQVIFRGIYLLQNKNSLKGVPVFIDEPEISMHPKWEKKIFDYYKNIFSEDSIQTSQVFIATHSEHILSNVLEEEDCLVIKIKNNSSERFYKGSNGIILPTVTIAEIKYAIFDIYTTDLHSLLYGHIQENYVRDINGNLINNPNIKQTDEWLKTQSVTLKHYRKIISATNIKEYDTLPTYIRNCINHPDITITYSDNELVTSINELIAIIKNNVGNANNTI